MSLSLLMFLSLSGTYVFFRLRADFIFMFGKDITGTDVLVSLCQILLLFSWCQYKDVFASFVQIFQK